MSKDRFQGHDYYQIDDLLTDEQILIRDTVRAWEARLLPLTVLAAPAERQLKQFLVVR